MSLYSPKSYRTKRAWAVSRLSTIGSMHFAQGLEAERHRPPGQRLAPSITAAGIVEPAEVVVPGGDLGVVGTEGPGQDSTTSRPT